MRWFIVAAILLHVFSQPVSADSPPPAIRGNSPLSPQDSMKQFVLHPDVEIQLVACEPAIVDPIASAFDPEGRLWVVEMRDYPLGPPDGEVPASRIRILRDLDGDGFFEKATTFAEHLVFPTGIQPWREGVIVTLAGRVMYMADRSGDDVCDLRETWFEGFAQQNTQLRANHPAFMVNNQIHISNGLRGGSVQSRSGSWPNMGKQESLDISGKDFAFAAGGGVFDVMYGNGQFGFSEDDFGNAFVCSNRNPCKHVALSASVIEADPWLSSADAVHDVVIPGEESRVYSLAPAWTTSNLHSGQFTAACGVHVFDGSGLPPEMRGNVFTCEPTGYLVQRQVIEREGLSFKATRGRPEVEFLASRDAWFRPVNLNSGPDGALYVVDMYRAVIEHPQFMPTELKERPDQAWGKQQGRIWRVTTKGTRRTEEDLSKLVTFSGPETAQQLNSPNRWHRRAAQRKLFEHRWDPRTTASLQALVHHGDIPEARSRAMHLLSGSGNGSLAAADCEAIIQKDPDPRVRKLAVELLPAFGGEDKVLRLALADEDLAVQATAWRRLSGLKNVMRSSVPSDLLTHAASNSLSRAMLMSPPMQYGPNRHCFQLGMLKAILQNGNAQASGDLIQELSKRIGYHATEGEINQLLASLPSELHSLSIALRLHEGIGRSKRKFKTDSPSRLVSLAERLAFNEGDTSKEARVIGIEWLATLGGNSRIERLAGVLDSQAPSEVRIAAAQALARLGDQALPQRILSRPTRFPPAVLRATMGILLSRTEWTMEVLSSLESGKLAPSALDVSQSNRLRRSRVPEVVKRAKQVFAALGGNRQEVIDRYAKQMDAAGNPELGKAIFAKQCSSCHIVGGVGHRVGPDISDSRTKTPEQLLVSILNPGAAIDANYFRYTIVTLDGQQLDGLLIDETSQAVTIRQAEGKQTIVPRDDIDVAKTSTVSLMPEGFEQQITAAQMQDLIAYIKNWRYMDGSVPGVSASN